MTTYTAIPNTDIDVDSPVTTDLMTKVRDNPIAISEGASGAPKIQTAALDTDSVTTVKITNLNVTTAKIAASAVTAAKLGSDVEIVTAWVNFNGSGIVAIRDDVGVSSITDNGTGTYQINLSPTLANDDYSAVACHNNGFAHCMRGTVSSSTFGVLCRNDSGSSIDPGVVTAIVAGG